MGIQVVKVDRATAQKYAEKKQLVEQLNSLKLAKNYGTGLGLGAGWLAYAASVCGIPAVTAAAPVAACIGLAAIGISMYAWLKEKTLKNEIHSTNSIDMSSPDAPKPLDVPGSKAEVRLHDSQNDNASLKQEETQDSGMTVR